MVGLLPLIFPWEEETDSYFHVKKTDKKHYVALDMANGFTYIGREEIIVTKGTPFAIDDGETSNLEDVIIVPTKGHVNKDGMVSDPAKEYVSLYRAWMRDYSQKKDAKTSRLGGFDSNSHVIRVWDLGQDIADKI